MLLLALLLACSPEGGPPPAAGSAPPLTPWSGEDVRPALEHAFFAEHDLGALSLYAQCVAGEDRPDVRHRGPFGIGNGRAFSLLGLSDPLNTLHNTVGPVYDKGARFFGDHWFTLEVDGQAVPFDRECIGRPRETSLAVTRAEAGEFTLYTVDFAPMGADAPAVLGRWFLLDGPPGHEVRVRHHAWHEVQEQDGIPVEWINDLRVLGLHPWQGSLERDENGWFLPLEDRADRAALAIGMAESAADLDAAWAALGDPEETLDETVAWWRAWSAEGVQVETEDPRIGDLYDGVRSAIRVQQGALGGISPMSRYTGVWLRDTIGPTRFLLRAGRPEEARDNLDYLYACHVERGDYGNACTGGLDPAAVGDPPDWAAMGGWSGRTGAEGPTYVPLAWLDHARWTGDRSALEEKWAYLRRGLVAQQIDEEGRQTFSGDETFRLMMGVAQGYPLEYEWQSLAWSANSSLLMLAAAPRMAEAAAALGEDPAEFDDLAARAEHALETTFRQEDGWTAPFVFHTAGEDNEAGEVAAAPFEDVNLKGLWAGAWDPEDPRAAADLEALRAVAGRGDGTFQSPPDPRYAGTEMYGVTIEEGVATGMVPGYALASLAALGDPEADLAFGALHRYAGPSGQYAEAILYDDLSALQLLYDASGAVGDVAARFRPWEGAINLDAMLQYLGGAEPVDGGLRLRPHLPPTHRRLVLSGLRAGPVLGTLTVEGTAHGCTATFASEGTGTLWLELPVPAGADIEADTLPGGERVVRLDPVDLAPGRTETFTVSW